MNPHPKLSIETATQLAVFLANRPGALMLLGEAGVLALETEVLMIETASEPGVLAKIAERLAEAEINIEYAYLAGDRAVGKGLMVLRLSDVEKARRVLE